MQDTFQAEQRLKVVCSMGVVQDGLVLWLDARAQRQLMKMGQSKSVWKDLSGNGNDCEVHREVFEYPPILEGGRNLLKQPLDGDYSNVYRDVIIQDGIMYWTQLITATAPFTFYLYDTTLKTDDFVFSFKTNQIQELRPFIHADGKTYCCLSVIVEYEDYYHVSMIFENISINNTVNFYGTNPFDPPKEVRFWDFKLEKGSQATPWTPAPEELGLEYPDWIQNFHPGLKDIWYENKLHFINSDSHIQIPEINLNPDNFTYQLDDKIISFRGDSQAIVKGGEIEYSGRNLLRNASTLNGYPFVKYGANYNLVNSPTYINGTRTAHIVNNKGLNDGSVMNSGIRILLTNLIPGEVYTFSFYGNDNWEEFHPISYYSEDASRHNPQSVVINSDWTRYSVEFTPRSSDISFYIRPNGNREYDFDVYLNAPKIEKGSQATLWTPAPEDITETNIINHTTPFVENNTIHTLRFYDRALTDEEILQNYRATHFLLEPKTFTSNDYYNYYDLNRVEINTLATKDLAEVLRGDINLEDIVFDRDMKSIPFADVLNRVEGNINILGNKLYKPKGWAQSKLDWRYDQPFSYDDANRLERNLLLLYNYAKGNIDSFRYCGMYTCGEEVI